MPKLQTLIRTARGIFTNFNNVNSIPEGGLLEAKNVEIDRPGVISKTRGRAVYGSVMGRSCYSMFEYQGKLHRHGAYDGGDTFEYDNGGTWTAIGGDIFATPTATLETRVRAAEVLDNLYCTGRRGVMRRAGITASMKYAGIGKPMDLIPSLTGIGAGMFEVDSQVAYRIVRWRKVGEKELVSAPSRRAIIANPKYTGLTFSNSTGTITVTHTGHGYSTNDIIEISDSSDTAQVANGPKTITYISSSQYSFTATGSGAGGTLSDGKKFNISLYYFFDVAEWESGDKIKIYRTEFSASGGTDPGDEMYFCFEFEIPNSGTYYNTSTDTVEEAFLGDPLYTNGSIQGIANANDRPPLCRDIALWKGHLWFAHPIWQHRLELQLDSISGLTDDTSSITIKDVGLDDEITLTFSTAEDIANNKFKRFTTEPTQAQNVYKTVESLCKVLNRKTTLANVKAWYTSESNDHPGKFALEAFGFGYGTTLAGPIQIKANNSTTGGKFTPALPTAYSTTVQSENGEQKNGLAHAKFETPDAVPRSNWDPAGSESKKLLRILPLRDSLILIKEDGIYRVSGETDGLAGDEFVITQLDPSIQAVAPHTWVVLNNSVIGLSTQGVIRVDETGTEILSSPVENTVRAILSTTDYALYTHAVAYESDRKYILNYNAGSAYATKALVYNYLTETWTSRERAVLCGHVLSTDDKLYECNPDKYTCRELKDFAATDHGMEVVSGYNVSSHGTTTFEGNTVSTVSLGVGGVDWPAIGQLFTHNGQEAHVVGVATLTMTLDKLLTITDGQAATITREITSQIRWRPEFCQNAGILKQFIRLQLYFETLSALRHKIAIFSDENPVETFLADIVQSAAASKTLLSIMVPRKMQRCRALHVVYKHNRVKEDFDILNVAFTFRGYGDLTSRDPR